MKRNRMIAIALPVLVILLIWVLYENVYLDLSAEITALREQQDLKMTTLRKYVALIAEKPELEKQLAALREQAAAQSAKLIEGEPVSLASANLQGTLKGILTGRGGTVSSERISKPEDADKSKQQEKAAPTGRPKPSMAAKTAKKEEPRRLRIITVSMDTSLPDTGALSDVLYSIETRTPYLVVKELDVRVRNFKEPRELMVRMDVSGLYGGK